MMVSRLGIAAVFAAGLGLTGTASAVPISVSFNVAALGSFTADTGSVQTATTITSGSFVVGAIDTTVTTNNIGLVSGSPVTLSPAALPVGLGGVFTKVFSTPDGTFTESLTVTSTAPSSNSLGVIATGTITETTFVTGPTFDPTTVFWSAAYTQNSGPGTQINGSFNDSTIPPPPLPPVSPPTGAPEPASLALLGVALAGLGAARRKKAKV